MYIKSISCPLCLCDSAQRLSCILIAALAAIASGDSYWIIQGYNGYDFSVHGGNYGDLSEPQCVEETLNQGPISSYFGYSIAVGCCTQDGSSGVRPDCSAHPKTHAEAVQICADHGYRLCTYDELTLGRGGVGMTEGTGCSYNVAYQWSSTVCNQGMCISMIKYQTANEKILQIDIAI